MALSISAQVNRSAFELGYKAYQNTFTRVGYNIGAGIVGIAGKGLEKFSPAIGLNYHYDLGKTREQIKDTLRKEQDRRLAASISSLIKKWVSPNDIRELKEAVAAKDVKAFTTMIKVISLHNPNADPILEDLKQHRFEIKDDSGLFAALNVQRPKG